jgi:hypothetical protein
MVHKPDGQRPASGPQHQRAIKRLSEGSKRLIKAIQFKLLELDRALDNDGIPPLFVDQYRGKRVPFAYSKIFSPQTVVSTTVNPTQYTLPRGGNIVVSSTQRFHWCRTGVFFLEPPATADIFDPAISGGGAVAVVTGGQDMEFELYDRTRSRKLTATPIPLVALTGAGVTNKAQQQITVFEPGTEVEPRLYCRGGPVYVNIVMMGFIEELG